MSKREFGKITEKEYRDFWAKTEQRSFLSSPEIAHLRDDFKAICYGVKEDGKLVAAAIVRGEKRPFGMYEFRAPRGVLVDYNDFALVKFFIDHLKAELIKNGGVSFRMDPNIERVERDIDGNEVKGGYNNFEIIENLKKLGFKQRKYVEGISEITWEFVLETEGKTEEELLAAMKPNTRRRLKQAEALGVEIRELKRDELKEFHDILAQTAERKEFKARDLAYYEKMYDLFCKNGEAQFVSAVIKPKECMARLEAEKARIEAEKPETIRAKRDHEDALKSIETRIAKTKEILGDITEDEIVLSSGMFFFLQPEIMHYAGGNADKFIKLDGQYVLQWEMIKKALHGGFKRYNFYGITANINEHPNGVYEFKRGFSGKVVELIGEYELTLNPSKKALLTTMRKAKRLVRH